MQIEDKSSPEKISLFSVWHANTLQKDRHQCQVVSLQVTMILIDLSVCALFFNSERVCPVLRLRVVMRSDDMFWISITHDGSVTTQQHLHIEDKKN